MRVPRPGVVAPARDIFHGRDEGQQAMCENDLRLEASSQHRPSLQVEVDFVPLHGDSLWQLTVALPRDRCLRFVALSVG